MAKYTSVRMADNTGDTLTYVNEQDAHNDRRMFIENGHQVSLIAGTGNGYVFYVRDLWNTETGEDWTE